jgi:hypothetical protein
MSFDAVREKIFDTFQSEFSAAQSGVEIAYQNRKFTQPAGLPWVYIAIVPGDSERKEISSSKLFCHYGVINVTVMVPEDSGTKKLTEMADATFTILADRNWALPGGARVTTYGIKTVDRGVVNGLYARNVMVEFRHEAQLIRA